jgi:alpha-L-rhamnosidase
MNDRLDPLKKPLWPLACGIALTLIGILGAFRIAGGDRGAGWTAARPAWRPSSLRCEDMINPLGLDTVAVRLSWTLESPERGLRQTAYQILVSSLEELLQPGRADLWDSGRMESSRSIHIAYAGRPLRSRGRYHWKVRSWDGRGEASPWSEPAWWEMGLLWNEDWVGQWIGLRNVELVLDPNMKDWIEGTADPAPRLETRAEILHRLREIRPAVHLRKRFRLHGDVRRDRAYICGLGYCELYLNGKKVGDHVLDPAPTDYDRRALYAVYDVTGAVKKGDNAAGVILGDGLYGQNVSEFASKMEYGSPGFLLQLDVEYADGSSFRLATDQTWKAMTGPILKANVFAGEVYDARREIPGWSEAVFEDGNWRPRTASTP